MAHTAADGAAKRRRAAPKPDPATAHPARGERAAAQVMAGGDDAWALRNEIVHGRRSLFVSHGRQDLDRVAALLGGRRVFASPISTAMDAHDVLSVGLPGRAVTLLVSNLVHLDLASNAVTTALGMSMRTYQRWKDTPSKPLSVEQSGRAWKFAEILARAIDVLGSQEDAERWLEQPATGLEQRRPIDLLGTPAGVELVEDHLTRLEYGVYA